ncbi:MAG TPA: CoA-binding protein [Bacteroidia bacterium]|nr:CoA-binding protein [Bacteroidia bacterium]
MKKTVVIGASDNPRRYSYLAVQKLKQYKHPVYPIGLHEGEVEGFKIQKGQPHIDGVDTITLYVGPKNQPPLYDYVVSLKPKRIIFNPGTENPVLENLARDNGIEVVIGCTLIMLSIGDY